MREYAVIDFETTGLRAGCDRVIEVAAVIVVDGQVVDTFSQLMNPGCALPPVITRITGISARMLHRQPPPEAVMPHLRAFLGQRLCIAHNASFDRRFFHAEMEFAGEQHDRVFLCSLLLARRLVPDAPSHRLQELLIHMGLPSADRAHRALADVLMTQALWRHLVDHLRGLLGDQLPSPRFVQALCRKPKAAVGKCLADPQLLKTMLGAP